VVRGRLGRAEVIGIRGDSVTEFLDRFPDLVPGLIIDLICLPTVACFEALGNAIVGQPPPGS